MIERIIKYTHSNVANDPEEIPQLSQSIFLEYFFTMSA
jgi:hypothetical protein